MKKKHVILFSALIALASLVFVIFNWITSRNYYAEEHRPQFHFSPEENWLNDPNGMVYYDGEYHLFYQHNPGDNVWGPMHWGHAISKDMINWDHKPIALEPDDLGMIFSGSAVVDWNDTSGFFDGGEGLVAIYTQNGEGQKQSIAYSKDKGRSWEKYDGNPVIPVDPEIRDFRDPKVFWHEGTEKWVMTLAAGKKVMFYDSPNLIDWNFMSEFGEGVGAQGGVWECPDLFELPIDGDSDEKKWVLQVDIGDGAIAGGSGAQYFIGDFDGTTFTSIDEPDHINWLDYGADFYAGQSFSDIPDEDGRRIMVAWMSNWLYANRVPTEEWRGSTSVPRSLELKTTDDGSIKLFQHPVEELTTLRDKELFRVENQVVDSIEAADLLEGIEADVFELNAEIQLDQPVDFGIKVRMSEENQDETVIGFSESENEMFVERSQSEELYFSPYFNGRHAVSINDSKVINLKVLVDKNSVEVFLQNGEYAITDLIFPRDDSRGLEFYVEDGEVTINSLEIHSIKSTWK